MLKNLKVKCGLVVLAWMLLGAVHAADAVSQLDVPAGELGAALKTLAQQTEINLVYQPEQVRDIRTQGVKGRYSGREAVEILLKGTPLRVYVSDRGAMVVAPELTGKESGQEQGMLRVAAGEADQSPAANSGTKESPASELKLEEVVVTAQKRKERLQDVPISISVLSGRDLDRSNIVNINEILNVAVPGVATTHNSYPGTTQLSVRGATAADIWDSGASPIAYYVDSVPFGFVRSALVPDVGGWDVQQVEALRGPQGTLYGANAVNGVVRVITHDADFNRWEFKTRLSAADMSGGGGSYRGDMAVNVPLIQDKLAGRIAVSYADSSGWIDNLVKHDTNFTKLQDVRLKLNAAPTDDLSLGASFWHSKTKLGAFNMGSDQDIYPGILDTPSFIDFNIGGFKIGYELPGVSISSSTSYIDYTNHNNYDISPFGFLVPSWYGQIGYNELDSKVFAEEINFASKAKGAWKWTAGVFYRDVKDHYYQEAIYFDTPLTFGDQSKSYAVFGELTRDFLDSKFAVTGGLRYFKDAVTNLAAPPLPPKSGPENFHHVSPRLVLTWRPTTQTTAYATYGEGFRSGLNQDAFSRINAPSFPPAKPDTLHNYELGVKGAMLNGRISYDTALYYIHWKDVQQVLIVPIAIGTGAGVIVNSKPASGPGIDLNLTTRPMTGLELGINMNWNDLAFDDDVFTGGDILFRKGDRLNSSPKYTFGAIAAYSFPLAANGLRGRMSATGSYHSQQLLRSTDSVLVGDVLRNVHLGFSVEAEDRWMVELYSDNVTNDRGNIAVSGPDFPFYNVRTVPRTVGLQYEYRFNK